MTSVVFIVFFVGLFHCSDACNVTSEEFKMFGPACQYMCHCVDDVACDVISGACSNGCGPGWYGPGCQFRDFAYKEFSRHSSNMEAYQYADRGNDGITTTCSDTNNASLSRTEPWWRVWLPRNETIFELTILTNDDGKGYFSSFTVTVEYVPQSKKKRKDYTPGSQPICHQTTNIATESNTIHVLCAQPLSGNQIRIQLNQVEAQLVLCDVRIYGDTDCPPNKCRYGCTEECHCKGLETLENRINGSCFTGCEGRWTEINDKCNIECANNKWGVTCLNECGACKESTCDVTTGECPGGCQIGYYSTDLCTEACQNQTWGMNCNSTCGNCLNQMCNASNGVCMSGCKSGYNNTTHCIEECDDGTYGRNCTGKCSIHCTDTCNKVDGACVLCDPGWTDDLCKEECKNGTWGHECNTPCGSCNEGTCNKTDGECESGCSIGYLDTPLCTEECENDTWGYNCNSTCGNCLNGTCNKSDGKCEFGCIGGFENTPLCVEECENDTWGYNCNSTCGYCLNGTCNKSDGNCELGCINGFENAPFCDQGDIYSGFYNVSFL